VIERKYIIAIAAILIAFSIGLVAFFIFSEGKPDGLEHIMDQNGVQEGQPVYHAPLDYGSGYIGALVMGLVGFAIVLLVMLAYIKILRKKKNSKGA
jgi:tryptophan-rich sensory protein